MNFKEALIAHLQGENTMKNQSKEWLIDRCKDLEDACAQMQSRLESVEQELKDRNEACMGLNDVIQCMAEDNIKRCRQIAAVEKDAARYEMILDMEWFQANAGFYLDLPENDTVAEFKSLCDGKIDLIMVRKGG